ncbi:transcription factor EGL1-like [Carica papaya]|uniref:transcription factor EGL1-like n=1 Tax=Carica papaya TaxID=3649 RepID=UPI000B8CCFDE|nr:transcription factor EGL1-like [Carica papaya]
MATGVLNQEKMPENLRKQLALAVRSIQWSYAIFWSISARQPGVLEWGDGYYNGDIKTRKTIQAVEQNADQLGLRRSEQLRELYDFLSAGENGQQARRPSAALSPEDLSDTEWYYLVCMSFVFNIGQGLPGRTLTSGQPTWLCNAHFADSKMFSRSLLAKSASIQTVVCFPFLGGVVELGVTDLVMDDPDLIQHVKSSILEIPCSIVSNKSNSGTRNARNDNDIAHAVVKPQILDDKLIPVIEGGELQMASPDNSSDGFEAGQPGEDSLMIERINGGASQVQSWHLIEEEFSNCVHHSLNSSDCISQTFVEPAKVVCVSGSEKEISHCLQDIQEYNHTKLTSLALRGDDLHYQGVLAALLKTSHHLILGPLFRNSDQESSFISWKRGLVKSQRPKEGTPQRLLKKVLFEVPRMHENGLLELPEDTGIKDGVGKSEADEITNHVLSERRRREKLNEKFMTLRSIIPSINKVDKISILDDTIEYLQELERRVEELESCRQATELVPIVKRKTQDTVERISDNYMNNKCGNGRKVFINKRKACDIDIGEEETDNVVQKDGSISNITVGIHGKEVRIELKCPSREGLLLEIMDKASSLHLDSHSVKSSTVNGILSVTIKSKYKGSKFTSAGMIKQELEKIAWKY